ncbi:long-chain fatty acid--CoA ligase [Streptomyces sp. NPDC005921]|uniref:AMP-dependent synthetase/ligase n=1 Tax=Streptomyces sp. NPDC005827 TaxID=3157070 RepID=UPI0033E98E92
MREFSASSLESVRPVGGLADAVFDRAAEEPGAIALGWKDENGQWLDVTAAEFGIEVLAVAKGLLAKGVRFGERVAIMCRTRYEWTVFDFACWTIGVQVVPIYPTASAEQITWILHDSQATAVVVENEINAMTVARTMSRLPHLRHLWQLDAGVLPELLDAGTSIDDATAHRQRQAVVPNTVATIIYTSGTTGPPKGCVITHGSLMHQTDTVVSRWDPVFHSRKNDQASTLLFLPLAHVFGRMVQVAAIRGGVRLGHQPELTASALLPDLATFKPTFIVSVPYIFERIFNSSRRTAEKAGKGEAFDRAVSVAVEYAEAVEARAWGTGPGPSARLRLRHQFWDRLVYAKLRAAMGGQLRHALSGGSAMKRSLGLFFAGAGISVYEGYGLTESAASVTINPPERTRYGTVGQPIPGTTVRIADDGEVLVSGHTLFKGYLNDEEASRQTLRGGWLYTGDLGSLDEDGYLTITGRKKEIIVTSGGKSVSPLLLEERVQDHLLVAQCAVVGDDRPYIAALVTLDPESVKHWLSMRGKPSLTAAELVADADLTAEIRRAVMAANTLVSQAESIRTFRVLARPFTVEEGHITPSLKLRRNAIAEAYAEDIEALYDKRP